MSRDMQEADIAPLTLGDILRYLRYETIPSHKTVEEHRSLGGNIISSLDNGAFVGLIYELLVFS